VNKDEYNAPFSHFDLWMTFDLEKGHLPCKDFPKLFLASKTHHMLTEKA